MKIIITESQLKNIILIEGDPVVEKGNTLEIKLPPNSFPSGKYSPINTKAIDGAISQINEYVSKYPKNTVITVTIESSESRVPNSGVKLNTGDLSRLRAEEVQKYLSGKLSQNVKLTIDNKGAQGPDWDRTKGSGHPDYTAWQYVNLIASVSGEKDLVPPNKKDSPICNFSESMKGGVAYPNNNFVGYSKSIDISKMPDGSNFKIGLNPRSVPDMLVVKAGNKIINSGFIGDPLPTWKVMLGTIFYHTYVKNGQSIPEMFPKDLKKIDGSYANLGNLEELLGHVIKINWSKSAKRNVDLIERAGGWYTLGPTSVNSNSRDDLFPGSHVGVAQFKKDNTMNTVEISVYSPIGTTIWDLKGTCL